MFDPRRLRTAQYLPIAASGILVVMSMSLAAPPLPPDARATERAAFADSPRIESFAAAPPFSSGPSAFGFLEFDWGGPDAVPGFGPWPNRTATATATRQIAGAD
jgi:hypothetical protein